MKGYRKTAIFQGSCLLCTMFFSRSIHVVFFRCSRNDLVLIFYVYVHETCFSIPPLHACNLHGVFGPVSKMDGHFIFFDLAQQQKTRITWKPMPSFVSPSEKWLFLRIYTGQTVWMEDPLLMLLFTYRWEFDFWCWPIYEDSALDDRGLLEWFLTQIFCLSPTTIK